MRSAAAAFPLQRDFLTADLMPIPL